MPSGKVFCALLTGFFSTPLSRFNAHFQVTLLLYHRQKKCNPFFQFFFDFLKYGLFMRYFGLFTYQKTPTNLNLSRFIRGWQKPSLEPLFQRIKLVSPLKHSLKILTSKTTSLSPHNHCSKTHFRPQTTRRTAHRFSLYSCPKKHFYLTSKIDLSTSYQHNSERIFTGPI